MPRHIQIAWGRYIFRLLHDSNPSRCSIWLRDLPLSLWDLAREYGHTEALNAYMVECNRTNTTPIK